MHVLQNERWKREPIEWKAGLERHHPQYALLDKYLHMLIEEFRKRSRCFSSV